MSSPRQLQVNSNGSWKTVVSFGLGEQTMERVKHAAQALHEVSPTTYWRITTGEGRSPRVLALMGRNTYGLWTTKGEQA